jgi:uncharacterized membrane protein YdjX (TVP38/TMEM64 family)
MTTTTRTRGCVARRQRLARWALLVANLTVVRIEAFTISAPRYIRQSTRNLPRRRISSCGVLVQPQSKDSEGESPPLPLFGNKKHHYSKAIAVKSSAAAAKVDTPPLSYGAGALIVAMALTAVFYSLGQTPDWHNAMATLTSADPAQVLQHLVSAVQAMGPTGVFYFALAYVVAELLCVPVTPLSLSAGYLFGLNQGVAVCVVAATVAASISFFVAKTLLRSAVEDMVQQQVEFQKIDKAIGKEGFKLLLLVRLSPMFPFAMSNYLYGASSIDFASFFWGTLLGFTPGTVAYVYTGMVGHALTLGGENGGAVQPWYVYGAGMVVLLVLLKLVTDVAAGIVNAIDENDC